MTPEVVRISDIIAYGATARMRYVLASCSNAWALLALCADVVENSVDKDRIEMSEAVLRAFQGVRVRTTRARSMARPEVGTTPRGGELLRQALRSTSLRRCTEADERDAISFAHHILPLERQLGHSVGGAMTGSGDLKTRLCATSSVP